MSRSLSRHCSDRFRTSVLRPPPHKLSALPHPPHLRGHGCIRKLDGCIRKLDGCIRKLGGCTRKVERLYSETGIQKLHGCIRKLVFGNYATIHISLMPLPHPPTSPPPHPNPRKHWSAQPSTHCDMMDVHASGSTVYNNNFCRYVKTASAWHTGTRKQVTSEPQHSAPR